jgi:hypothetical protein
VQHDRSGGIEDADVHASVMQIDAAVESVLLLVKPHHGLLGQGGEREPASWLDGTSFLKVPR